MIADGLTKVLPTNKWDSFLDQLGLVQAKATEEMNPVALEEIQAQLDDLAIAWTTSLEESLSWRGVLDGTSSE
jgi:hypothetical protein